MLEMENQTNPFFCSYYSNAKFCCWLFIYFFLLMMMMMRSRGWEEYNEKSLGINLFMWCIMMGILWEGRKLNWLRRYFQVLCYLVHIKKKFSHVFIWMEITSINGAAKDAEKPIKPFNFTNYPHNCTQLKFKKSSYARKFTN